MQYPEAERRKKDIDLIVPSHPLRPIALHCLKDRDTERPSADELCGRLASLKREPRYTHSVEQTREHRRRRTEIASAKEQLRSEYERQVQQKELTLHLERRERAVLQSAHRELLEKQLQDKELFRKLQNLHSYNSE